MPEDLFREKLDWFKENEKPEVVLIVADNPEFIKIVIAWTNLEVKRAGVITELAGESENKMWDWLWKNVRFKLDELKANTGVSFHESVLESKMQTLIGNHILYPDGTVNSFVQRYLRECVLKLFETKTKKHAKTN